MPISRKRKGSSDADDAVTSKKRSRGGAAAEKEIDGEGNPYWMLSAKRRLQISEFKGMTMVNIREYYEKDGKSLPGKAGINLPLDQFKTFLALLPQLVDELEEKGAEIERPKFGAERAGRAAEDAEDEESEEDVPKPRKSNIEATSDEGSDD